MQMRGLPTQPYAIIQQLQNHVEVKQMFGLADIWKEKPAVLMIVHPGELSDEDYYNLDQYLLRGGKAMIFLDPYNETAAARQGGQFPERITSSMDRLLNHWGLEMIEERVAGDRAYARMVNAGDDKNVIPAPFLSWLSIRDDSFSQTDAVTSQISLLNMQSAGILRVKQETSLNFEPLIQTSPDSQEIETELLTGDKPQILKILEDFKPGGKPLTLAARVSGTTTTMFPDGPPEPKKEDEEKSEDAAPAAESQDEKKEQDAGQATEEQKSEATTGDAPAAVTPSDTESADKPAVKADVATRDVVPTMLAQADTKPAAETGEQKTDAPAATEAEKPAAETTTGTQPATESGAAATGETTPEQTTTGATSESKPAEETKPEEKAEEEAPTAPPFIAESSAPLNVILVADADLLEDRFWVQTRNFFGQRMQVPFANNADFVVNAVENLSGGDDLIGLRSRGTTQRPFTKIAELKLTADRKYRAEEQRLRRQLEEAEKKLAELEQRKEDGTSDTTVDDAVKATKAQFVEEVLTTRKSLRQVNLSLREDIESLDWWLKFLNIALIPILVGILAIVLGLVRIRRRKQHGGTA
ncbi:MAG: Gldg family protein, partial [Pseudomonadota bacterium]